jgi:1-deoxy-D-xylulose-5-phosphate synthase
MWDMSILQVVPGLRLAAPRDESRVRELLREAVDVSDAPTVLRLPKGPVQEDILAQDTVGSVDVIVRSGNQDVLIVAAGAMVAPCVEVADRLRDQGIGVTLVDPRWVKPLDPALVDLAGEHRVVVSVEDNGRVGGMGAVLAEMLADAGVQRPLRIFGIPQEFLAQGKRNTVLEEIGLSAQGLAREITAGVAALETEAASPGKEHTRDRH